MRRRRRKRTTTTTTTRTMRRKRRADRQGAGVECGGDRLMLALPGRAMAS